MTLFNIFDCRFEFSGWFAIRLKCRTIYFCKRNKNLFFFITLHYSTFIFNDLTKKLVFISSFKVFSVTNQTNRKPEVSRFFSLQNRPGRLNHGRFQKKYRPSIDLRSIFFQLAFFPYKNAVYCHSFRKHSVSQDKTFGIFTYAL